MMCTIIGVAIPNVTADDVMLVHRVMLESRIRGLHATGVSYTEAGVIKTIKEPMGADRFLEKYNYADFVDDDGALRLIAHCRYSTSDLEFNQPIANDSLALAHNGVISQELPENWERLYGFRCETRNDTELLFKTVQAHIGWDETGDDPLAVWTNSSIAAVELYANGRLRAYRNGRRPLYWTAVAHKGYLFASTKDILTRSGVLEDRITILLANYYHIIHPDFGPATRVTSTYTSKDMQI